MTHIEFEDSTRFQHPPDLVQVLAHHIDIVDMYENVVTEGEIDACVVYNL